MVLDEAAQQHISQSLTKATDFMASYINEPDHVAVILASSKIDALLGDMLRARLLPSPTSHDGLLDSDRGLSTFSARITAAYRLGLIDQGMYKALDIIRRIRNDFAHTFESQNLSDHPHCDRVAALAAGIAGYQQVRDIRRALDDARPDLRAKIDFVMASAQAIAKLETVVGLVQRVDAVAAIIATYP